MEASQILILIGAFAGGYVSGLTGFGTGLAALPFWLYTLNPALAAPLVVVCSIVAQLQTLPAIWHAINWRQLAPFVLGGVIGVPFGTVWLSYVSPQSFKLFIGCLLIVYCSFMLTRRSVPVLAWGGRSADGAIGFGGGALGGVAGLSGVLPTLWVGLRGWRKDASRGLFQVFNLSILSLALASQTVGGLIGIEVGKLVLIALPGTIVGAWSGRRTYRWLGDDRFSRAVLILLLLSGVSIIFTTMVSS